MLYFKSSILKCWPNALSNVPFRVTSHHTLQRRLILLQQDLAIILQNRIRLDKDLSGRLLVKNHWACLPTPPLINVSNFIVQFCACLHVCSALIHVQLLQQLLYSRSTVAQNLRSVKIDLQVRQIFLVCLDLHELISSLHEGFQDRISSLHVYLSPFTALGIPVLECCYTCSCHLQVCHIEHISSLITHVLLASAEAEKLQDLKLAAQDHSDALSTAFFVRRGD